MTGPDHERFSDDVGAHLLGALSEIEARAYERHTAVCPERPLLRLPVAVQIPLAGS